MAWRLPGDKPPYEPIIVNLLTHISCIDVTRSQWVKCAKLLRCLWLTHWGRVTHVCVSKLTIFGSDNGLSPGRRQAIIWTNAGILLIRTLGTNFSEILGEIHSFSFKKMHLKMSSAGGRLFSLGLNELNDRTMHINRLAIHVNNDAIYFLQKYFISTKFRLCQFNHNFYMTKFPHFNFIFVACHRGDILHLAFNLINLLVFVLTAPIKNIVQPNCEM